MGTGRKQVVESTIACTGIEANTLRPEVRDHVTRQTWWSVDYVLWSCHKKQRRLHLDKLAAHKELLGHRGDRNDIERAAQRNSWKNVHLDSYSQ